MCDIRVCLFKGKPIGQQKISKDSRDVFKKCFRQKCKRGELNINKRDTTIYISTSMDQ